MVPVRSDIRWLCVFDIDGTLVDNSGDIPPDNVRALSELRQAGAGVTLATGRTALMTGRYTEELGITLPVISSNGALVASPGRDGVLYRNAFPAATLRRLLDYCAGARRDTMIYTADAVYFSPDSRRMEMMRRYNGTVRPGLRVPLVMLPGSPGEAMAALPDGGDGSALKVLISYQEPEDLAFAAGLADVEAVESLAVSLDIMPAGSTKGRALRILAEHLGIGRDRIFAFGDEKNDLPMFAEAGYSAAPANADAEVRAAAAHVADPGGGAWVALAVDRYVMKIIRGDTDS